MKKRILPALLALCMVMSLLPAVAFAEDVACTDENCTLYNEGNGKHAEGEHVYNCTCEEGETKHEGHTATYTAASKGDGLCPACAAAQNEDEDEDENENEEVGGEPSPAPTPAHECTGLASCQAEIHDPGCRAACNIGGCTKSKGHTGDHNGTCSQDEHCPVTNDHLDGCPKGCEVTGCSLDADHGSSHNNEVCQSVAYCGATDHYADCPVATQCSNATSVGTCDLSHVIDGKHNLGCIESCDMSTTCPATGEHKTGCLKKQLDDANGSLGEGEEPHMLSATAENVEIILTCDCFHDNGHALTGTEKCGAEAKTISVDVEYVYATGTDDGTWNAYSADELEAARVAAYNAAVTAITTSKNAEETAYCDECIEGLKEAGLYCTEKLGCSAGTHTTKCPEGCTMGADCPNEVGNASAHMVVYVLYDNDAVHGRYGTAAEANAVLKDLVAADKNHDHTYVVRADGCPMAFIADAEVVGDGEKSEDSSTPGVITKAEDFSDVDGSEWYAEELTAAIEKGIITGTADGSFEPTRKMDVKQMAVMLGRIAGQDLKTDGDGNTWFVESVAWATKSGLLDGIEDGELSRKDMILILWRLAGTPESNYELSFEDIGDLDGDHLAAMKWAVENGIVNGDADANTVRPGATIQRSEIVAVMVRFDKAVNK